MYLYTTSELSESMSAKAAAWAISELQHENDGVTVSNKEMSEARQWHIDHNNYLLKEIFDQFRWISVRSPFADGMPVSEWRHEISSDIANSSFNGLVGHKYLSVNYGSLDVYLDWYLDKESRYQQSDMLERWIVDMLIYDECRKIALDCAGRLKNGALNSLPFFMFGAKRRIKEKLNELLPKAVITYQGLDSLKFEWSHIEELLNEAYSDGVEWRHPLPNFVTRLATRQKESVGNEKTFASID